MKFARKKRLRQLMPNSLGDFELNTKKRLEKDVVERVTTTKSIKKTIK